MDRLLSFRKEGNSGEGIPSDLTVCKRHKHAGSARLLLNFDSLLEQIKAISSLNTEDIAFVLSGCFVAEISGFLLVFHLTIPNETKHPHPGEIYVNSSGDVNCTPVLLSGCPGQRDDCGRFISVKPYSFRPSCTWHPGRAADSGRVLSENTRLLAGLPYKPCASAVRFLPWSEAVR